MKGGKTYYYQVSGCWIDVCLCVYVSRVKPHFPAEVICPRRNNPVCPENVWHTRSRVPSGYRCSSLSCGLARENCSKYLARQMRPYSVRDPCASGRTRSIDDPEVIATRKGLPVAFAAKA